MPPKTRYRSEDHALIEAFGARLRELRTAQGLTQEELAARAGIEAAEVGFYERGEREPGLVMINRLADGLDAGASALLAPETTPHRPNGDLDESP